jgi:hypothetical protein
VNLQPTHRLWLVYFCSCSWGLEPASRSVDLEPASACSFARIASGYATHEGAATATTDGRGRDLFLCPRASPLFASSFGWCTGGGCYTGQVKIRFGRESMAYIYCREWMDGCWPISAGRSDGEVGIGMGLLGLKSEFALGFFKFVGC